MKDIQMPGLSITRSLGDSLAHDIGVISSPYVAIEELNPAEDVAIVVASDGVWDFMDAQEVVEFLQDFDDALEATEKLVELALSKQEGSYDNITAVVLFLEKKENRIARLEKDPHRAARLEQKLSGIRNPEEKGAESKSPQEDSTRAQPMIQNSIDPSAQTPATKQPAASTTIQEKGSQHHARTCLIC